MPDDLTPLERELIDAAVADGKITHVPVGASGFDGYHWDKDARQLRSVNPEQARAGLRNYPRRGAKPDPVVAIRRARVAELVAEGKTFREVCNELDVADHIVRSDANKQGLKFAPATKAKRRPNSGSDKAADRKAVAAEKTLRKVKDRRRFTTTPIPTGETKREMPGDATGTRFTSRVTAPDGEQRILKSGTNNSKIGGQVLVGRLKGAEIFTLTLEERATCPRSCAHWTTCYGNQMDKPVRWQHGPQLVEALSGEIADLCAEHERVLIRLHVLGDFYDLEYVAFWEAMLATHPGLHVFGFTAWKTGTEIGDGIADVRTANPDRFMIRHSATCAPWGSFTINFPTDRKQIGDAVVCPEQRDAMEGHPRKVHCGSCAVCWSCSAPIVFVEH